MPLSSFSAPLRATTHCAWFNTQNHKRALLSLSPDKLASSIPTHRAIKVFRNNRALNLHLW